MKKLIILAILIVAVSVSAAPPAIPPMPGGGSGADANAYYLLLRATNAPTNGTSLGALTTGLVLCTTADSVCTPSTVAITADGTSFITAADYAAMKALLDLEIGTDVQAYNSGTMIENAPVTTGHTIIKREDGTYEGAGAPVAMDEDITTGLMYYNATSGEVENAPASLNYITTGYVDGGVLVVKSTDATITVSGMSIFYVNADDDAIAFNLPAAATNKAYCFANALYARAITVNPDDADYIINGATAGGAGKQIVSTGAKDEMLCVVGIDASYWRVTTKVGTWALEE